MKSQSLFGVCGLCGGRKTKNTMTVHLKQCLPNATNGSPRIPSMLLRVQASYAPMYWMYVTAGFDAKLGHLDDLLRHVWLECCEHLSEFYTKGRQEVSMNRRISEVFYGHGDGVKHVYDFGSSTELDVYFAGFAEGSSVKPAIAARNEPPVWPCEVCGEPAATVCVDCYEGFSCAGHAKNHRCGQEMLLPVVNSPRMGVCGYTG